MKRIVLLFALLVLPALPALAVDEELYDPAPPPDSAFVRLLNTTGDKPISGILGSVSFKDVKDVSPYMVLKAGTYDLSVNKAKESFEIKAGGLYSFAYSKDGKKEALLSFEDAQITDPAKATVYFYNLSDKEASLRAPNFNTDIISKVAAGTSQSKELNALTLDVALTVENTDIETFKAIELKRRNGFTFMLLGKAPSYAGVYAPNAQAK